MQKTNVLRLLFAVSVTVSAMTGVALSQCVPAPDGCDECEDGRKSSLSYLGGYECGHGPENDQPDCTPVDCCETKPGGCTGAANECNCYECLGTTCEGVFRTFLCHCGKCSAWGFDQNPTPGGTCDDCELDSGPNEILDEQRLLTGSCDPGENTTMLWVWFCDEANGFRFNANCIAISENCVYAPNSTWQVLVRGDQYRCGG